MDGIGGDQTLTPDYPGISDAADMTSWDPPFPVDLKRVRQKDEDYWDRYRAAPKAIIPLADGQRLWGSRYGKVSSLRLAGQRADRARRASIRPRPASAARTSAQRGGRGRAGHHRLRRVLPLFQFLPRGLGVAARVSVLRRRPRAAHHRGRRAGGDRLLASAIRRAFVREGAVLAAIGAVIGTAAAVGYGALIMYGLRTWWVGAVGTTELTLHVAPQWLAIGVGRRAGRRDRRALARRARHEPPIGALAAERRHRRADRACRDRNETHRRPAAILVGAALLAAASFGRDRSHRRLLWRRRRVARRRAVRGVDPASPATLLEPRWAAAVPAMFALGFRHTVGAARAIGAEPRADRLCVLRARQRRRVQQGCLGRSPTIARPARAGSR